MAMSAVPFALQNASHNANLFRQAMSSLVPPGGGIVTPGDFKVTQTGTPSMAVQVGVGRIWIPGTEVANVSGGNFSSQAMYYAENESNDTRSVATSDPTNPRIDIVYAYVKDSAYSGVSNLADYAVQTGTPAPGSTYPTNAPAIPNDAVSLAWIMVNAGASSIVTANITQLAIPYSMRHMEWSGQTPSQTSGAGQNFGNALTTDTTNTYNGGFATMGANGTVTFSQAGVYVVEAKTSPLSSYTNLQLWAFDGGGAAHLATTCSGYGGQAFTGTFTFAAAVNSTLQFGSTYNVTAASNVRVKITKVG